MDDFATIIVLAQGFVFIGIIVLIIILAIRRYKIKQDETFEKRDN